MREDGCGCSSFSFCGFAVVVSAIPYVDNLIMAPKQGKPTQSRKDPPSSVAGEHNINNSHRKNERSGAPAVSSAAKHHHNDDNDNNEIHQQEEEDFCKRLKVARLSSPTEEASSPSAAAASVQKRTAVGSSDPPGSVKVTPALELAAASSPQASSSLLKTTPSSSPPPPAPAATLSPPPPRQRRHVMDLESALHKVTLLSSSLKDKQQDDDKHREYLVKPASADTITKVATVAEQRDDDHANETMEGGATAETAQVATQEEDSSSIVASPPAVWVTFRLAHPGDASKLASLYKNSEPAQNNKNKLAAASVPSSPSPSSSSGTSEEQMSLLLAEGLGDEDKPPSVYGLLAEVHEEKKDNEKRTTVTSTRVGATMLLTAGWRDQERIIRIEWYTILDDDSNKFPNLSGHVLLRLASLAVLTDSALVWTTPLPEDKDQATASATR